MRVLLDTSILISNLLSPKARSSATGTVLRLAFAGRFTLLFVAGVVEELYRKLAERPDLAARIPQSAARRLIHDIRDIAEPVPKLPEPYPRVARDRDDDFLIAHAVLAAADYLVTWDKDLLVLGEVEGVKIVTPPEFLRVLREAGRL